MSVICIGPVCVSIWQIGLVVALLFRPIWTLLLSFVSSIFTVGTPQEGQATPSGPAKGLLLGEAASPSDLFSAFRQAKERRWPLVLKFGASWCGPCNTVKPHFRGLVNQVECVLLELDVDSASLSEIASRVSALPTFWLFESVGDERPDLTTVKADAEFVGGNCVPDMLRRLQRTKQS